MPSCAIISDNNHSSTLIEIYINNNTTSGQYLCSFHSPLYDLCYTCFNNKSSLIFYLKNEMTIDNGTYKCKSDIFGSNNLQRLGFKLNDPTIIPTPMVSKADLSSYLKTADLPSNLQPYALKSDVNTTYATKNDLAALTAQLKKLLPGLII